MFLASWLLFFLFLIVWAFGIAFSSGWWPWVLFTFAVAIFISHIIASNGKSAGRRRVYR